MTRTLVSTSTLAAIVLLLAGLVPRASAQTFVPTGRDTLRGLPGVEVAVENLEDDVERDGLTGVAIKSDVEQRLRARGILVYASQKANPSDAKAFLYVHVTSVKLAPQDLYAIGVQVHLRQTMRSLVTASNVVDAMTWDANDLIVLPVRSVTSARTTIQELVDKFIDDWSRVHR